MTFLIGFFFVMAAFLGSAIGVQLLDRNPPDKKIRVWYWICGAYLYGLIFAFFMTMTMLSTGASFIGAFFILLGVSILIVLAGIAITVSIETSERLR